LPQELRPPRRSAWQGDAPAIAQAGSKTLRYVPQADLSSLDPVFTGGYPSRNFG
jgi:hypothetical protein